MYPRIDSPCPLNSIEFPAQGNFNCGVCKREVHNLTRLTRSERDQFLAGCAGEVCVSYKVKASELDWTKGAIAGLFALSAAGFAVPLLAEPINGLADNMEEILVGGVKLPEKMVSNSNRKQLNKNNGERNSRLELIPVVEELEYKSKVGDTKKSN